MCRILSRVALALEEVRPISPPVSALLSRALGNLLFYIAKPLGFALLNGLAYVWVMNELEMSWQLVLFIFIFFWRGISNYFDVKVLYVLFCKRL